MRRLRRLSYEERLLLLFLVGSICGCMIANLLGGELLEQIGSFDFMSETSQFSTKEAHEASIWLLRRRMMQLGLGCLIGMTPIAIPAFSSGALLAGGGMAVMITICTVYGGWLGIWIFLKAALPQMLCYLPVVVILAAAAEHGTQRMKGRVWLLLVVLTAAGGLLEVFSAGNIKNILKFF